MSHAIHIGDTVQWVWGDGTGTGTVTERFTSRVTRTIGGSEITRNASDDEPAYLIEQDDGAQVLESVTEIRGLTTASPVGRSDVSFDIGAGRTPPTDHLRLVIAEVAAHRAAGNET